MDQKSENVVGLGPVKKKRYIIYLLMYEIAIFLNIQWSLCTNKIRIFGANTYLVRQCIPFLSSNPKIIISFNNWKGNFKNKTKQTKKKTPNKQKRN